MKCLEKTWKVLNSRYLQKELKDFLGISWRDALRLLEGGKVHVDSVMQTNALFPVHKGQEVSVNTQRKSPRKRSNSFEDLVIIEQNSSFIVISKPSAMAVMPPTKTGEPTLCELLSNHLKLPVMAVHRLDAGTSGLMVLALTSQSRDKLIGLWRGGLVRKKYLALVWGTPQNNLRLDSPIKKIVNNKEQLLSATTCILDVHSAGAVSQLLVETLTGRKHQIRQHLSKAGFPILGDDLYGNKTLDRKLRPGRLALHACELSFPWQGQQLTWQAPAPDDFSRILTTTSRLSDHGQ